MPSANNKNSKSESSRVKRYFGGPGIIVFLSAAFVIMVSLIVNAMTEIDSSRYVVIGAAIIFVVATVRRTIVGNRQGQ